MARRNIVERYSRANVEKRVEIILDNYATFNRILNGYEKVLALLSAMSVTTTGKGSLGIAASECKQAESAISQRRLQLKTWQYKKRFMMVIGVQLQ